MYVQVFRRWLLPVRNQRSELKWRDTYSEVYKQPVVTLIGTDCKVFGIYHICPFYKLDAVILERAAENDE